MANQSVFSFSSSEGEDSRNEASVEQLRGTPIQRPFFGRQISPVPYEPEEEEFVQPLRNVYEDYEAPLEQRSKIPGCGINHHDMFCESVKAETEPIQPKPATFVNDNVEDIFDQFDQDHSYGALVGCENFIQSHFQQQQYFAPLRQRQPPRFHIPPRETPASSSSSSSSDDDSFSGDLRQRRASTYMSTPLRRITQRPLDHNTFISASQEEDNYSPESSPSQSPNSFKPLHTSTFIRRSADHSAHSYVPVEYESLSRDDFLYHTAPSYDIPGQSEATCSIHPIERSSVSSRSHYSRTQ